MPDIKRKAKAVWTGDLRTGKGIIDLRQGIPTGEDRNARYLHYVKVGKWLQDNQNAA